MDTFLTTLGLASLNKSEVNAVPAPVLAYIGDAVYELYVRLWSMGLEKGAMNKHHRRTVQHVKASTQAAILKNLWEQLTEEELDIVRRGRNAKTGSVPKNAGVVEYRHATGFESLLGYLYLSGSTERLESLIAQGLKTMEGTDE